MVAAQRMSRNGAYPQKPNLFEIRTVPSTRDDGPRGRRAPAEPATSIRARFLSRSGEAEWPLAMTHMLGVESEVGQPQQAIVHRPGLELTRLTPSNCDELLFDDVLWAYRAREEHDIFTGVLRDQGVSVHHFADLFAQPLALPEARAFVLDRVCSVHRCSPSMNPS